MGKAAQRRRRVQRGVRKNEKLKGSAPQVPAAPPPEKEAKEQKKGPVDRKAAPGRGSLYTAGDMILLVGEGDFSFSCSLLNRLGPNVFIMATVLDSNKAVRTKYRAAATNIKYLSANGGEVRFGVDCRQLHKIKAFQRTFTKIVFNFPHVGGDGDSVTDHQELLRDFFASATSCLELLPTSEIHVTLRAGQPYTSWRVQTMAKLAEGAGGSLRCNRVVPFHVPRGYHHQRTRGEAYAEGRGLSEHNLYEGAKTYVFRLRKDSFKEAEDSE